MAGALVVLASAHSALSASHRYTAIIRDLPSSRLVLYRDSSSYGPILGREGI